LIGHVGGGVELGAGQGDPFRPAGGQRAQAGVAQRPPSDRLGVDAVIAAIGQRRSGGDAFGRAATLLATSAGAIAQGLGDGAASASSSWSSRSWPITARRWQP